MSPIARTCPQCESPVDIDRSEPHCPHCQHRLLWSAEIEPRTLDAPGGTDREADGATLSLDGVDTASPAVSGREAMPAKIGRFEIRRELGEGAFGRVYEAYDPLLDRAAAIKVAKLDRGDSASRIKRFLREAKSAANLRHPHIVPLYEYGQDGDQFYIASAFIVGKTLASDLDSHPQPELPRAARVVLKLAEALGYAHSQGIVHRDVKPANTMIDEYDQPLLMDFGLATRQDEAEKLTHAGQVMGTPRYMAPEQAKGSASMSLPASDQYSLGVMLYEMVTGQPVFEGTPELVMFHHMETEPPRPSKMNPSVSRDLETICLKCLEKDPQKRYADCRALAEDLRHYLAGEPITARAIGTVERLGRWCKRKPALAAANASVVVGLIVVSALLFVVKQSLDQEQIERARAVLLAQEKQTLADNNKKLAGMEKDRRIEAQNLAIANKRLADDFDERREASQELALQVSFNRYFEKSRENSAFALIGTSQLLAEASKLKNRRPFDSMRIHAAAWLPDVDRNHLCWIANHGRAIRSVAISADGKICLSGSENHTARLWDVRTGNPIGTPLTHQNQVQVVALSANGQIALTGSLDGTARLWETATGKPIGELLQHRQMVLAVALSADGNVAMTGSLDKTAQLWEAKTGKPIGTPLQHEGPVTSVAFSTDGKVALTSGGSLTPARMWDTATGKSIGSKLQIEVFPGGFLMSHSPAVLSADGKLALTGATDHSARLWDALTGKSVGPPLQHLDEVKAVALSANGKIALTGSMDKTARLWTTSTGNAIGHPLRHQNVVQAVALSANGKIALTGSYDDTSRVWNAATGEPIGPPLHHGDKVIDVALSADGKFAVTGCLDGTLRLWEIATGQPPRLPLVHEHVISGVALSADGKIALTGSFDNTAQLWEVETGQAIGLRVRHEKVVYAVALSTDGKIALSGSNDNTAQVWGAGRAPIELAPQHKGAVKAVALSADGRIALTGSTDRTARLWDTTTGKPIGLPLEHRGEILSVALSPNGKVALTGSVDHTARLWNTQSGMPIGPPLEHRNVVNAVALSSDGRIALTGSGDSAARVWNTDTGRPIGPPLQHLQAILCVTLSADGMIALTGSADKTAKLWDTTTGQQIGPPLKHQYPVWSVALSKDAKIAFTGTQDMTAQLWETATGKQIGPVLNGLRVALNADGTVALSGGPKEAQLSTLRPLANDPERVALWAQTITGIEVDEHGNARALDANAWTRCRQRSQDKGGPPVD